MDENEFWSLIDRSRETSSQIPDEPAGEERDDDDLDRMSPKLAAKFG